MKKLIALLLVLTLVLALCACGTSAEETAQTAAAYGEGAPLEGPPTSGAVAVLSQLNLTEDEYSALLNGKYKAINYTHGIDVQEMSLKAKFYDTLDAQIMALEAGDVDYVEVPHSVAQYLCAHNDKIKCGYDMRPHPEETEFNHDVNLRSQTGLSFLMLETNTVLRDAFDKALADMKADGTLEKLVQEYITDAVDDGTQKAVAFEKNDGETVKVGVTGSLPPIDYVAPDGTFEGFNTAILAEIGRRTGVNIELVQVDSIGRATALSSGIVDAVLWTRAGNGHGSGNKNSSRTQEERTEFRESKHNTSTPEEQAIMSGFNGGLSGEKKGRGDMPDGTIITEAYYTDLLVMVSLR